MARDAKREPGEEREPEVAALAEFEARLADYRRRKSHARVVIHLEYGRVAQIEFCERVLVTGS